MTEFLVYDAKVAVLVAVFYLFYRREFRFDFVAGYKCKQQGCNSKYFLHCLVLHCLECERIAAIVVIIRVREAAADDAFNLHLEGLDLR